MDIEYRRRGVLFDTAVEEWMAELYFTEVMNLALEPCSEAEKDITRILDHLLYEVMYGVHLDEAVAMLKAQPSRLIRGRQARKGEQLLNTAMGNAVDNVFKNLVERELQKGKLSPYSQLLTVTPAGERGPDVYKVGSPMVAWDVTTRGAASNHVERDNFQRGWNRYYLLIWDEPGTGFRRGKGVQRLPRLV